MKILKITFENINSLKGSHTVNFETEPLREAGLFAITGPTGSGKTTILDGICLALYNRIPRLGKLSKREIQDAGSVLTRHTLNARASVVYQCHQGMYTSEWTIRINRNGNLSDYSMNLYNVHGTSLGLKKNRIPEKNAALIGLEYEQFVRSILLAQGDFARFLESGEKQRAGLLENITGTFIYRTLGKMAYEKGRELKQKTEALDQQIKGIKEQLIDEDTLKATGAQYFETNKKLEESRKEEQSIKNAIELKKDIDALGKKQNAKQEELAKSKEANENFYKNEGSKLKVHLQLEPFRQDTERWNTSVDRKKQIDKRIARLHQEAEDATHNRANQLNTIAGLTGEKLSAENAMERLDAFCERYAGLKRDKKELKDRFVQAQKPLTESKAGKALHTKLTEPGKAVEELKKMESSASEQLRTINDSIQKNAFQEHSEEAPGGMTAMISNLAHELKAVNNLSKESTNETSELKGVEAHLQSLPDTIEKQDLLAKNLNTEVEKLRGDLEIKTLRAKLETHRKELVDGEPCPLCGAEHHPWAQGAPKANVEKSAIVEKEKESNEATYRLSELKAEQKTLEKREEELKKALETKKEQINNTREAIADYRDKLPASLKDESPEVLQKQWNALQELQTKQDEKTNTIDNAAWAIPQIEELVEIKNKGWQLKKELENLYNEESPLHELKSTLEKNWDENSKNLSNLAHETKAREEEKTVLNKEINELESTLLPELKKSGFASIQSAREKLLPYREEQRLTDTKERLAKQLEQAKSDLGHYTRQLEERKKQDSPKNKEALDEAHTNALNTIEKLDARAKDYNATLKKQRENKNYIKRKKKEKANLLGNGEKWLLLNEQIGDAQGNRFSAFAQKLTLELLIELANGRLRGLSNRYRLSPPHETEDLVVIDRDMGELPRSVKTLSGGETFLISLALALALSDLTSRNIPIESMFIDEGFGTLDPETLDQTLDVLEKLQANDERTIGIISHVDALKERISTQIKLSPTGQGYSRLEITG